MYEARNTSSVLTRRHSLNNRFIRLRTESHHYPGFFQQLGRIFFGLTCRLYVLRGDIDTFKREVEVSRSYL